MIMSKIQNWPRDQLSALHLLQSSHCVCCVTAETVQKSWDPERETGQAFDQVASVQGKSLFCYFIILVSTAPFTFTLSFQGGISHLYSASPSVWTASFLLWSSSRRSIRAATEERQCVCEWINWQQCRSGVCRSDGVQSDSSTDPSLIK